MTYRTSTLRSFLPEIFGDLDREEQSILQNRVRYEGYIVRELERLERLKPLAARRIPEGFDYEVASRACPARSSRSARRGGRARSAMRLASPA